MRASGAVLALVMFVVPGIRCLKSGTKSSCTGAFMLLASCTASRYACGAFHQPEPSSRVQCNNKGSLRRQERRGVQVQRLRPDCVQEAAPHVWGGRQKLPPQHMPGFEPRRLVRDGFLVRRACADRVVTTGMLFHQAVICLNGR